MIPSPHHPHHDVAIIGAGFGGLGMGIKLKQAKRNNFIILERASELGGTWRDNTYPGCACDVPSVVYSFSFDQNPNWTHLYSKQPEILAYLRACVERFNIRDHIRFNSDVCELRFVEADGYWEVKTRVGEVFTARHVVSAMGPLNRPNMPNFPGLDKFQGEKFHSSQWRHDVDLTGKRVAVVGTGASAIQFIPEVAKQAGHVTVFQRTPPWVIGRHDQPVAGWRKQLYAQLPQVMQAQRGLEYLFLESRIGGFMGNPIGAAGFQKIAERALERMVPDPTLRAAVTPNYKPGCKRILVSDDYYPALMRDNVTLVTHPVDSVTERGVVYTNDVECEVDVIIFGTGFVASEYLIDMSVFGRNKRELITEWGDSGPNAYRGTQISGYPNLFFILGPNTGLGHNSVVHMMESQYAYIFDYFRLLEEQRKPFLDVKPEAQVAYNDKLQQRLANTIWQSGGCQSWYQMANGKNTTLWPGSTIRFRREMRRVSAEAYF